MIERAILVCRIMALLVLGVAQASTPEEPLDEVGIVSSTNITQANETVVL